MWRTWRAMGHNVCAFWVPALPLTWCLSLLVPERECGTWQGARLSCYHPSLLHLHLLLVLVGASLLPAGRRQMFVNCLCSCILPLGWHRHQLGLGLWQLDWLGMWQLGWLGVRRLGWLGMWHLHTSSSRRALLNARGDGLGLGWEGSGLLAGPGRPTLVLLSRRRAR